MTPGSVIPDNNSDNNLPNLNNILSQDETDYLLSHFETYRKYLRCPNCEKKGIFRRNGSTKSELSQPIFRCTGCGSSFRAKTTLNISNFWWISLRVKCTPKEITIENFVSSEVTTDDINRNITSSPSSFFPSDLIYAPVGYICRVKMCEFEDVSDIPLPIPNSHFAALVTGAKKKFGESPLFPTDRLIHLYAPAILSLITLS
ncbi:uncharacterized protein RHIMIDRAFT_294615 [Rhizopus microsporus ATCC 52813]|uniref:Uncharacterized protein n=1 Tax=Rhizopus microsporus ATCC 52813 TaxID=1340429 RepID=A0A2G4SK00_RHIZD|nr:uncharacterized protein RHIMIDRAFT_294615 [Rhizopus microsporus ATCC 52813]PHZ09095.1 hypothetical protein RHIMIDRAFT_294615 [Rhizopus microsporus ATCC 52813]